MRLPWAYTLPCLVTVVGLIFTFGGCGPGRDSTQTETSPSSDRELALGTPESKQPGSRLEEGWRQVIPIPDSRLGEGDEYVVWVEKGWLQIKRQTKTGQTDWLIVLARASDPKPPIISARKGEFLFALSYREGRYFLRETTNILRCVRERKMSSEGTYPLSDFLSANAESRGSCGVSFPFQSTLTGWEDQGWFIAATGPESKLVDCLIRIADKTQSGNGYGFISNSPDVKRIFYGDTWLVDDGELLITARNLEVSVKAEKARNALLRNLLGSPPPALDGKAWFNCDGPISWDKLHGKVVLLDFWATWCGPCREKLPKVQALYDKLQAKGFLVIGIHDHNGGDKLSEFLKKQEISFPVVLDEGKIADRFGIESLPSYLLVDKNGKVVRGVSNELPTEEEIENLLKMNVIP
jgi:thiol-disulfide isomerase/thioredoxin